MRDAVQSILNQTYADFRFIIVDNASTDTTRDVIASFHDPRIELIPLPHDVGQTRALNLGLERVDTEYVARMDADDVSLPTRFFEQVSYLDANPDVVLVGSFAQAIDCNDEEIFSIAYPTEHEKLVNFMPRGNPIIHPVVTMRTDAVRIAGGYSAQLSYAQDLGLWLELVKMGRIANIARPLIRARMHGGQQTRSAAVRQRRFDDALELCRRMGALAGRSDNFYMAVAMREQYLLFCIGQRSTAVRNVFSLFRKAPFHILCNDILWAGVGSLCLSIYRKWKISRRPGKRSVA